MRANSLEINPDFDPQSATQSAEDSTAERLRLETALEQWNEQNEKLMADNESLATERDEFREESERLGAERDRQLSERCWELSRELFKFHDEADQHDPEEIMREYERRFKGRVDRVRVHLKRVGWWDPKESTKEQLENPKNLADILSLADYLNASGAHRFW